MDKSSDGPDTYGVVFGIFAYTGGAGKGFQIFSSLVSSTLYIRCYSNTNTWSAWKQLI